MFHAGTTERRFIFRSWRLNFPQKRLENRTKVRSKIRNEFSRRAHFRRIFAAIFRAQRNIVRKFARIRTIGVPKIRRNIAELSFEAKLRQKAPKSAEKHRKAPKSQEIRRNADLRLLDNTVSCWKNCEHITSFK